MSERKRTVVFAKISRPRGQMNIYEGEFESDLKDAINPRVQVGPRYGRVWRVSRPKIEQGVLKARLGFVKPASLKETHFNEEKEDFETTLSESEQGSVSHFVVDLLTGRMIFEERKPDIKIQSFIGAFRGLLRISDHPFDVFVDMDEKAFSEWLNTVERVVIFDGTFEQPNPGWTEETREVQNIITAINADKIELKAQVDPDSDKSLEISKSLLGGIVVHVERGYGKISAVGIRQSLSKHFRSDVNAQTDELIETTDDTSDSIFNKLIQLLKGYKGDRRS